MENDFVEHLYACYLVELQRFCALQFRHSPVYMSSVDDVVQDVFLKALKHETELRRHPNPYGWLALTCRNACKSIVRRDLRRREILGKPIPVEEHDDIAQQQDDIVRWMDRMQHEETLSRLQASLSPLEQKVYDAYFVQDNSAQETADLLRVTVESVRGTVQRIRRKALRHETLAVISGLMLLNHWLGGGHL